ncbi:hypothetical protein ACIBL6_19830 [Streptomyces sp. NPDC050400]|uniref:hypothetical protein n=1 Tax=Streptomyces sp. NPDC050400 TaxID=3365610 RepID=UPI0037923C5D
MTDDLLVRCGPDVPPYMLIIPGILFAVAPAVVWMTIARTRPIGFTIGGTLLAGASLLIGRAQDLRLNSF